jgi:SLOG cluster2
MSERGEILPAGGLQGVRLGISVSESADLGQLGLGEIHLKLALAEATRAMLISGGRVVYGGHLDPGGYTSFLWAEMEKYSRRDKPLVVCLPWSEHRRVPLADLVVAVEELGLYGEIVYLGPDGAPVEMGFERGEVAEPVEAGEERSRALTAAREYLSDQTDARLLLGGKRTGYQGRYPGILEEALISIRRRRPIFLAGGFGGVTMNVARALGLDPAHNLAHVGIEPEPTRGLLQGLRAIADAASRSGWRAVDNGLDTAENLRLAATHRPSEVASLVALGLGRLGLAA